MKFIRWYQKLIYNRYGIDQLYYFFIHLLLIVVVINLFLSSSILLFLELILFIIMIYRKYSKSIEKRRLENSKYLLIKDKIDKLFHKKNLDYIYKKCRNCKTILRFSLPGRRGLKYAICPNCHKRITIWCFRKQHIEIIKKERR